MAESSHYHRCRGAQFGLGEDGRPEPIVQFDYSALEPEFNPDQRRQCNEFCTTFAVRLGLWLKGDDDRITLRGLGMRTAFFLDELRLLSETSLPELTNTTKQNCSKGKVRLRRDFSLRPSAHQLARGVKLHANQ